MSDVAEDIAREHPEEKISAKKHKQRKKEYKEFKKTLKRIFWRKTMDKVIPCSKNDSGRTKLSARNENYRVWLKKATRDSFAD